MLAFVVSVFAQDTPAEPAELVAARARYQAEVRQALDPIRERHLRRPEALQRTLTREADLNGANAVAQEIERVRAPAEAPPPLDGSWTVRYDNDGAVRTYQIRGEQVRWDDQGRLRVGELSRAGDELLLDFGDGKLERLSLKPVLQVEHFDPKELYRTGRPSDRGTGELTE